MRKSSNLREVKKSDWKALLEWRNTITSIDILFLIPNLNKHDKLFFRKK